MSRIDFGAKPWVFPMPVLIVGTYDENGVPNAMNAAWGCITDMAEISISMSEHKTTDNFSKTGAFTVAFATEDTVVACDYVGVESANKVPNKFEKAGFTAIKSSHVNAPIIQELPMSLECKVKSFEDGILIGEIVNVNAEESILTNGTIDYKKLKPITYDPVTHDYVALGAAVGKAFSDGMKLR
ncbi:MAG: flavin reductase family protein [Lachnospiraceae bacterium]|nr:flavin reductase family protein [Lachnospiraceae bacterium]